jgi:nucleoside-diphosphate-sugar epimerase
VAPLNAQRPLVLVTGATGFVGTALCAALPGAGFRVRQATRAAAHRDSDTVVTGDIDAATDWTAALDGVDAVVHLAARTHDALEATPERLADYRRINVDGTRRLAAQAAASGVRRFLFMSSVKVNGESTLERPFRESDAPRPRDAYGTTKLEAEQVLAELSGASAMQSVVLRPPLVYGAGVKGNFLRLLRLLARGVPLPLASVRNRRSLIYLGNLVDAILTALRAPQAAGRTYLVSDADPLSTPDLLRHLARALGREARLLPCPPVLLRGAGALIGRSEEVARLTGSLEIDATRIASELGWTAPHPPQRGFREAADWYNSQSSADASAR